MLREGGVLLQKLDDAVRQLRVVEREAADFMEWDQHFAKELLVLGLQRQGEAVDNAAQDFQQLTNPVKVFSFINEPATRDVIYLYNGFNC